MPRGVGFSFKTVDKDGATPDMSLIGKQYRHSGNKKVYTLTGFAWNGNSDQWMTMTMREGSLVPVVRTLKNFAGKRKDERTGKLVQRYTEIAA